MPKSVLIVCTSKDKFEGAKEELATGSWMEEVAAPYYIFKGAGYDVKIASITGGGVSAHYLIHGHMVHDLPSHEASALQIPFDDASLSPPFLTPEAEKFLLDDEV